MIDVIVILIILAIVIPAIYDIRKAKKKGQVCIGCASASKCGSNCHCNDGRIDKKHED